MDRADQGARGSAAPRALEASPVATAQTDRRSVAARPGGLAIAPGGVRRPVPMLPNLRRNVCPHFFITGARGAFPIQAPHLLKALIRQSSTVSRCQLRGGVHLAEDFVNDVCLGARFNQCVFYEDDLTRDS